MYRGFTRRAWCAVAAVVLLALSPVVLGGQKRLLRTKGPGADLKQLILWGSECRQPEGKGFAFGGAHQRADDGRSHTRLLKGGKWVSNHDELRKSNPLQQHRNALWTLRTGFKNAIGRARCIFFEGSTGKDDRTWLEKEVNPALEKLADELAATVKALKTLDGLGAFERLAEDHGLRIVPVSKACRS